MTDWGALARDISAERQARASGADAPRARSLEPIRFRVEMREPLGEVVVAFDTWDEAMARYLENQLLRSRSRVPRTLRWPITVLAYDIDNTLVWEEAQ